MCKILILSDLAEKNTLSRELKIPKLTDELIFSAKIITTSKD